MAEKESRPGASRAADTAANKAGQDSASEYSTESPTSEIDYDALLDGNMSGPEEIESKAAVEAAAEAMGRAGRRIFWSAGELLAADLPDPVWIVPNLLPAGLSVLAGRPKLGKSWLALQVAIAVGTGGIVLGERVQKRRVLYLALEDGDKRLKSRLSQLQCPSDAAFDFLTEWPALIESGLDHLIRMIEANGYELVIADTLARWAAMRRSEDEHLVARRLADLQRYTQDNGIGCLLVDHHRKAGISGIQDVIDDVMGATSKTGVADAALGLYRARGQQGAELKLTGRDVMDRELAVQFDPQLCCWQLLGEASDVKANTLQHAILDALTETFGGESTCSEVARFLGKDRANVYRELQELVSKGKLQRQPKAGREVQYRVIEND